MSFLLPRRKFITTTFTGTLAFLVLPFNKVFSRRSSDSVLFHTNKGDSSSESRSRLLEIARTYGSEFGEIDMSKLNVK